MSETRERSALEVLRRFNQLVDERHLVVMGPQDLTDPLWDDIEAVLRATPASEGARERERALLEVIERSTGVFRRACEIAEAAIIAGEAPAVASARLRDAIETDIEEMNALVALATPQEAGDE